jgi:hypothetical protein
MLLAIKGKWSVILKKGTVTLWANKKGSREEPF